MKYISIDELLDFEFHDSEFSFDFYDNGKLSVWAQYLNIHEKSIHNPFASDMEIDKARIVFENFNIISYEPGRTWKEDEHSNFYTDEPLIVFCDQAALDLLITKLKERITVFDFGIKEGKMYFMDATAGGGFFTTCFSFDKIIIEWDDYRKPAWYTDGNT